MGHFVVIDKVDVLIKNLNIKVKQSNHKLLFKIAKPLLLKVMRPVIQKVIEKQIRDNFEKADAFAYKIHQDAMRAKEAAKDDSMFKNISLPGGISTKATEYKQLAAKGDRWESPIFSIGSASASSDVPKLRQVTRKPHGTSRAKIQGGNHPNSASSMSSGAAGTTGTDYGSSGAGYGGSGLGGTGGQGSGIPQSSGFSNQVDQAFGPKRDVTGGRGDMTNGSANKAYYDSVTQ